MHHCRGRRSAGGLAYRGSGHGMAIRWRRGNRRGSDDGVSGRYESPLLAIRTLPCRPHLARRRGLSSPSISSRRRSRSARHARTFPGDIEPHEGAVNGRIGSRRTRGRGTCARCELLPPSSRGGRGRAGATHPILRNEKKCSRRAPQRRGEARGARALTILLRCWRNHSRSGSSTRRSPKTRRDSWIQRRTISGRPKCSLGFIIRTP